MAGLSLPDYLAKTRDKNEDIQKKTLHQDVKPKTVKKPEPDKLKDKNETPEGN
jgi:hypothetical protein